MVYEKKAFYESVIILRIVIKEDAFLMMLHFACRFDQVSL
jgi:hypothetical protein